MDSAVDCLPPMGLSILLSDAIKDDHQQGSFGNGFSLIPLSSGYNMHSVFSAIMFYLQLLSSNAEQWQYSYCLQKILDSLGQQLKRCFIMPSIIAK